AGGGARCPGRPVVARRGGAAKWGCIRGPRRALTLSSLSFPGSAWERAAARLCLARPPGGRSFCRFRVREAEPRGRAFPGRAWERELFPVPSSRSTFMSTPAPAPPAAPERFHTREELDRYIEQQATAALEKAVASGQVRVERRVPWVTSGPVGQDSAGYSVLKAAAFAMGFLGPEQAKEEVHVHQQLRELYKAYGFVPHYGHHSFLVPLATAHLPTFEPQGRKLQEEIRAKMTAHQGRFDPAEARWIAGRLGGVNPMTKALGTISDTAGGTLVQFPVLGELIDLQRNLEVLANAGCQEIALPPNGRMQFPKLT